MVAPPDTTVRNLTTDRVGVVSENPDAPAGEGRTVVTYDGHDTVVELDTDLEVVG